MILIRISVEERWEKGFSWDWVPLIAKLRDFSSLFTLYSVACLPIDSEFKISLNSNTAIGKVRQFTCYRTACHPNSGLVQRPQPQKHKNIKTYLSHHRKYSTLSRGAGAHKQEKQKRSLSPSSACCHGERGPKPLVGRAAPAHVGCCVLLCFLCPCSR